MSNELFANNIGPYCAVQDVMKALNENYNVISTVGGLQGMTLVYRKWRASF